MGLFLHPGPAEHSADSPGEVKLNQRHPAMPITLAVKARSLSHQT